MKGLTKEVDGIAAQLVEIGQFGSIRVSDASGQIDTDRDGDPVLRFKLTLTDPPRGQDTWPLDDVERLQQTTDGLVAAASYELPYTVIETYPESREQAGGGEDNLDEELGRALDHRSP
jgi:hypothetical protein